MAPYGYLRVYSLENLASSDEAVSVTGEDVSFDLAAAPHILVGGTTGSGKSVCLHSLLLSLLLRHQPDTLQLALIDPKQVEFAPYAKLPNLYRDEVATDVTTAREFLAELVAEMEARYAVFTCSFEQRHWPWPRTAAGALHCACKTANTLADSSRRVSSGRPLKIARSACTNARGSQEVFDDDKRVWLDGTRPTRYCAGTCRPCCWVVLRVLGSRWRSGIGRWPWSWMPLAKRLRSSTTASASSRTC